MPNITSTLVYDYDLPNYQNRSYQQMRELWTVTRDCYEGTRRLREKREVYLPKFEREYSIDYEERLKLSVFTNFFRHTAESLVGMIFRRAPRLGNDVDPKIKTLLENCDSVGTHWVVFGKQLGIDAVRDGHVFIYVDMPKKLEKGSSESGEVSLLDEELAQRNPYWVKVLADQIVNWKAEFINGRIQLTQVTIEERVIEEQGTFGELEKVYYRILRPGSWELNEIVTDKDSKGNEITTQVNIDRGTTSLSYIPLVPIYGQKVGFMVSRPPLIDLADLNILHYQIRSDLHNIMRVCNVPVLFGKMLNKDDKDQLVVGPHNLVQGPEPESDLKYVEHSGQGIGSTQQELLNIEAQMEKLGIAMLASREVTATEAVMKEAKASSELGTIAQSIQDGMERALEITAEYLGLGKEKGGSVELADINQLSLSPAKIATLSYLVDKHQISLEAFLAILERAGELPEAFDIQSFVKEMERMAEMAAIGNNSRFGDMNTEANTLGNLSNRDHSNRLNADNKLNPKANTRNTSNSEKNKSSDKPRTQIRGQ